MNKNPMKNAYKKTEYKKPFFDEKVSNEIIHTLLWNIIRELNKYTHLPQDFSDLKSLCLQLVAVKKKEY